MLRGIMTSRTPGSTSGISGQAYHGRFLSSDAFHFFIPPNDQLTDGGPPPTPESPNRSAGPPFGEASGSAFCVFPKVPQASHQPPNGLAISLSCAWMRTNSEYSNNISLLHSQVAVTSSGSW